MNSQNHAPTIIQTFWVLFFTFLIYILLAAIVGPLIHKTGLIFFELLLLMPLLIFLKLYKFSFTRSVRWKPISWKILILSAFIGFGIAVIVDEMNRLLGLVLPIDQLLAEKMQELMTWHSFTEAVCLFFGGVIIAALVEELLFRGFFQKVLESHMDITKAIFISALIFAMLHFQPWFIIEFVTFGIILGVLSWRTDNVLPAVIAHGTINCLSLVFTNASPEKLIGYEMNGHVAPGWIIVCLMMVIGGLKGIYQWTEKKNKTV